MPGQHTHRFLAVCCMTFTLLALLSVAGRDAHGAAGDECVGKPYGYPGCPTYTAPSKQTSSLCGNAVVDEGEQCDDGAYYNGAPNHPCAANCTNRVCGDGRLDPDLDEECEPATEEVYARDAETGQLTTQKRFVGATCGMFCTAPACDADGDCAGGCKQRFLPACVSSSSVPAIPVLQLSSAAAAPPAAPPAPVGMVSQPVCGNAVLEAGEACDNGPSNSDARPDACRRDCQLASCGDGIVDRGEQCDDGNRVTNDGCTNDCRMGRCGNGIVEYGEQCDDGAANSNAESDACRLSCIVARCGDGVVDRGEECDDGNKINIDGCTNICQVSRCGDGIVQSGEQCDAGNRNSDTQSDACRLTCVVARCGDGVVDTGEQCDDANRENGDACTNECKAAFCGDGFRQPGEQCDDGKNNSDIRQNACRADCLYPRCGDGVTDKGEGCDGGANCTAECRPLLVIGSDGSSRGRTLIDVLVAAMGGLVVTLVFVFRKQIVPYTTSLFKQKKPTIDEVPLSEIENPFHQW